MRHELTKIVYKPAPESNEEFSIIVHPAEYKRWKEGDTTVALAEVVDSFQMFWSNQGAQGILGRPSKQQLENAFGSSKDVDVVTQILTKGKEEAGKVVRMHPATNVTKSSFTVDTRGKSLTGI